MSAKSSAHLRGSADPLAGTGDGGEAPSDVVTPTSLADGTVAGDPDRTDGVLVLIAALCGALEAERVRYCHWKSNEAIARSASGENDLDLLVARPDAERFERTLRRLGFKDTDQPPWKQLPGIYHSYGLDATGVFVHIHAHYQLVIGDDMTKNIHLPIEDAYIAPARSEGTFPIPSTAFELLLFLIRMVVKHSTWDAFVSFQGSLSKSERRELEDLLERTNLRDVWQLAEQHLPFIPRELLERCLRCVQPGASRWLQIRTAARLQRALAGCSRRPPVLDTGLRMWRRARTVFRRKVLRRGPVRSRLASGGALVAIVGGDGAGKTTVVDGLSSWLATEHIDSSTVHMGKPSWSALTTVVKGLLKLVAATKRTSTSSGKALRSSLSAGDEGALTVRNRARLVWEVLTARDRFRTYRKARRLATNGSIVICDRYPLPEVSLMDGAVTGRLKDPSAWGRWAAWLARIERGYYERISEPDTLVVLRVDPDTAVERRQGLEPESSVRPRSEEIWRIDWSGTAAIVIDAASSKDEVLSEVKAVIWSRL
jgi:thymidylate kinase